MGQTLRKGGGGFSRKLILNKAEKKKKRKLFLRWKKRPPLKGNHFLGNEKSSPLGFFFSLENVRLKTWVKSLLNEAKKSFWKKVKI